MNIENLFSQLRQLLNHPIQDESWNQAFCTLLETVAIAEKEIYQEVWVPYCEQHKHRLKRPIAICHSLRELSKWSVLAPFATLELHLDYGEPGEPMIKLIVAPKKAKGGMEFICTIQNDEPGVEPSVTG